MNGFEEKEDDGLSIPEFLRRRGTEKKSQENKGSDYVPPPDPVWERQRQLREAHEEQNREKARKRISKLKAERGTWDPKQRKWVSE